MSNRILGAAVAIGLIVFGSSAFAATVTPDVIFGSGNANGSFTTNTGGGVEVGLRAKLRFDENNLPQNIFNYDGGNSYVFEDGAPGGSGFGFAANSSSTASWNFEWSINSNVNGTSGFDLDDLTYVMSIDYDSGPGTNFFSFDPVNVANADHAIGNNSTGNGGGTVDFANYASLIAINNVAQNSWNVEFFDQPGVFDFDNSESGVYTIALAAFDGTVELASTSINVQVGVVPVPAALPLLATAIAAIGLIGRRRRRV